MVRAGDVCVDQRRLGAQLPAAWVPVGKLVGTWVLDLAEAGSSELQHLHNFFDLSADAWNRLTRVQCDVRVSHGLDRCFNDVEGSRSLLVGADGRGHSDRVALV